jgi:dTDP-4-amino-4,6-dideoxygalactose transaminase
MARQSTNQASYSNPVIRLEKELADFTGAPYVVATDCCTHALELCLRYDNVKKLSSTCYTYLSVPMTFVKLGIDYQLKEEHWIGEYNLKGTRIWDSARLLHPKMYRRGQLQCVSFGNGKPLDNKRGGAILCGTDKDYEVLKSMSYDGRDPLVEKWHMQKEFRLGFHYNMPYEHAESLLLLLDQYKKKDSHLPKIVEYPDCRKISIKN